MTEKDTSNPKTLKELSDLLEESISIYRQDRQRAIENYQNLRSQLNTIIDNGFETSEEAKLEAEVNKALKLTFEASKRLDDVIRQVTSVIVTQLNNETREKVAKTIGGNLGKKPVDFDELRDMRSGQKKLEYDEEEEE